MAPMRWAKAQLDGFHEAAQSLKLYRRAELQNEADGSTLIEQLYVDPLPNSHALQTVLKANTTILIGRKGTGKSTIFQRAQHELRKKPTYASAYIDIKTVYESSQVDPDLMAKVESQSSTMPKESLEKLLLYKSFLRAVIKEIRDELKNRIRVSFWDRVKRAFGGSLDELFEGLDGLLEDIDSGQYMSVTGLKAVSLQTTSESSQEETMEASISSALGLHPEAKAALSARDTARFSTGEQRTYADILMIEFNIKEFILRLKALLNAATIKHLYIFVDDFSELPEGAMTIVVDALLAPLNNWSDELIKFKIAAYPGRVYYGDIDKTKIDELNLDLYKLYGTADVSGMEDKAIDFTRRLVERRIQHFCGCDMSSFMEPNNEDMWRSFFYATMANPRIFGYILYYLYESNLIYDQVIGLAAIKDAARKYYEEKIDPYFGMNRFLHETFAERSSIFSLKELLEAIVARARELRGYRSSAVMREIPGRPPTSHFHVVTGLEGLLSTLELNFFLTKYYEMSDRDARKVSVFALNYGLCNRYAIEFGRPTGKREYRLYYVERIFDDTPILENYIRTNQEIVCDRCARRFDASDLPALNMYGMKCPTCRTGVCRVTNLSRKYESMLKSIAPELLLPRTELGILQTLQTEKRPLFAAEIAEDLDCSYQLVGKRGKNLAERGLVDRTENEQGRRQFQITGAAEAQYFEPKLPALSDEAEHSPSEPE